MHVMERRVGSGVLKKKSSSGCLIIKKAGAKKNYGGGLGGLGDSSKGKKRARLIASGSDSNSSDEDESLDFMRRKVNEKRLKKGYMRNERDNAGIDVSAEKKKTRLDLFEFDEYDEFDGKMMRNEILQDRFKRVGKNDSENVKKSSVSLNRNLGMDKLKKSSYYGGSSSGRSKGGSSSGRSKGVGGSGMRDKGFGSEDDEANLPISMLKMKYQERAAESIRLQGKNGVLKVMVNKKKNMDFHSQPKNHDHVEKDLSAELPVYPDSKAAKNRGLVVGQGRSVGKEKEEMKLEKVYKARKAKDSGVDESDMVLKLEKPRAQACSSKKAVKKEVEKSPSTENLTPVKGKEDKESSAKRGGSTEKQMLREKIRGMLLDAGWRIDYRPRRNRDYLDAVYINPSGTAYWSIVKAYDAFKKQLEEDDDKVKAEIGAPLSEDLINKLTRQTKKKISEELKRKRKEDGMAKSAKKSAVKEAKESSDSSQSEERLSSYTKQNHKSRVNMSKADEDSDDDSSDDSLDRRPKKVKFDKPSTASKSNAIQGRTSKVIGRCTLLVRGSDRGDNADFDGYVPYRGKRTVLAWLIDCGTAKLSEKVQYMNRRRTRVMLEGWITRDGIHCGCCSKILTVSKFELHAGSKLRQPFQNIILESGSSLLQCQIDAWNSQEESLHQNFFTVAMDGDDPDDDACGICGDGGDLICCDSCPSTFHQTCVGIQMLPSGDWHCPYCTCKFPGHASGNMSKENDIGSNELNRCIFCEKKYHKSCSEKAHIQPTSSYSASFCGPKCQEIHDHLQKIIGVKHELEAGLSWSLIQRTDVSDASEHGFPLRVECNSKLAVALSVMNECFLPIIDRRSGINIIQNVVYNIGANFNRLNYHGFYTAILERGDEIIAAASIRLHGDRLAEMPFIGTREIYRRQGMCRRLLSAIETELSSLNVGQLIIPAISEHMNTWTTVFGFDELEDVHKKEMKSMNMLVFPGTDMLRKQLVKQENSDGVEASESSKGRTRLPVLAEKAEVSSSGEQTSETRDEVSALDSGSPAAAIPSVTLLETENPVANTSDAVCDTELENTQNVSSDNLECSQIPNDDELLEPPAEDDSNSLVKGVVEDGVCESENENKQKECSPIRDEDGKISDEEHKLLEPSAEDDSNSLVKGAVGNSICESENENKQDCSPICDEDGKISNEEHGLLEPSAEDESNSLVKGDVQDCVCESENENKQNDCSCKLESSSIPAEDGKIPDEEHILLEPSAEHDDSNSLVKCVAEDGVCESEMEHRMIEPSAEDESNSLVKDAPKTEDSEDEFENGVKDSSIKTPTFPEKDSENGCVADEESIMAASNANPDQIATDQKIDGVDLGVTRDILDRAETDKPDASATMNHVV